MEKMGALVQQSPEWLEMRKTKIGASDAPVIMGISPWKTPYQLWEEKLGIRESGSINSSMQRGIDLEEKARLCFESKTDLVMIPQVIMHPEHEWMMASLDGMDIEQKHIVEIKCAGRDDHELARKGKIPEKYLPQIQHQLEVTGLKMAYYFSFDGSDGVIVEVGRDQSYIDHMVEEEESFYKCMQRFIPPATTSRDYDIKSDEVWHAAALEWMEIQKQIGPIAQREKELREMLIAMARGQSSCGSGVKVTKIVRKGNIDYGKIPQLKHLDLDKYRKDPLECWRISEG